MTRVVKSNEAATVLAAATVTAATVTAATVTAASNAASASVTSGYDLDSRHELEPDWMIRQKEERATAAAALTAARNVSPSTLRPTILFMVLPIQLLWRRTSSRKVLGRMPAATEHSRLSFTSSSQALLCLLAGDGGCGHLRSLRLKLIQVWFLLWLSTTTTTATAAAATTTAAAATAETATTAASARSIVEAESVTTAFNVSRWIGPEKDWLKILERERNKEKEEENEYFSIISPNWESGMETWGRLWPFHVYFFGALFLLLLSQVSLEPKILERGWIKRRFHCEKE